MAWDVQTGRNLLDSLRKIAANFGKARKFQRIDLTNGLVHKFTILPNYQYAQIRLETSSGVANTPVARYTLSGETPSSTVGMPLLGWEVLDITDAENLINFQIIGLGGTEYLDVTFFNLQM